MAQIIVFPNSDERDWRELETMLREDHKDLPDGPAIFEECLPRIRELWTEIFATFSVSPSFEIPGPLSEQQTAAIKEAVTKGVNLVAERLQNERRTLFAKLVLAEYKDAYYRRHGHEV